MEIDKLLIGPGGERAAARYLEQQGYEILERNYRIMGSEVDLIAKKDETICFVEVKTRGTDDYGLPEEFVDDRKRRKIIRAAKVFTGDKKYENFYVRFDIISVLGEGGNIEINHITHAFQDD
ncbi:MAG: YraN family protein [Acidobacteria bacterium]|jgi:putative endonuclease|nr:YraN family protein [Acidobacteriota bacterium]